MRYISLFLLIWYPIAALAVIYVKEDGNSISYSDAPIENGKKLDELPEVNQVVTSTATPPVTENKSKTTTTQETTTSTAAATVVEEQGDYNLLSITSPKDQETFQNQPSIPVEVKVEPKLREGDHIMLVLDDKPWGEPSPSTRLTLNNVERGFHILGAVIIDGNQKILKKSNIVTIYVHRSTLNNPTRQQQSQAPRPNLLRTITNLFSGRTVNT